MTQQSTTVQANRPYGLCFTAIFCVIALAGSMSIAVSVGAVAVPLDTVWGILMNKIAPGRVTQDWSMGREAIVWDIRLPRTILACFVGAGLAMVGASLQAVTHNPLADPHLLGISAAGLLGPFWRCFILGCSSAF